MGDATRQGGFLKRQDTLTWSWIGLVALGVIWQAQTPSALTGWALISSGFGLALWSGYRPRPTPIDAPLLLLVLAAAVSSLVSPWPETAYQQAVRLWVGLLMCYVIIHWVGNSAERLHLAVTAALIGGVALAVLAPAIVDWNEAKAVPVPAILYRHFTLRISDPVHPNILATLLNVLLFLPLANLIVVRQRCIAQRLALAVSFLLLGGTLLLTKSRGGYLAAAAGFLAVLWLSGRRTMAAVLTVTVILILIWVAWTLQPDQAKSISGPLDPTTWAFRREVWGTALRMLKDFPLTGVGPGVFNEAGNVLYPFAETRNPGAHNVYLQVGVDLGVPGLVGCLAVLIEAVWLGAITLNQIPLESTRLRATVIGLTAGIISFMVHGWIDVAAWNTRAAWIPWSIIGLLIGSHNVVVEFSAYTNSTAQPEERKKAPR